MKRLVFWVLSLLFIALLSGCGGKSSSAGEPAEAAMTNQEPQQSRELPDIEDIDFDGMAPDIEKIIQRGSLIIAIPSFDTPLFYETDGKGGLMGFDIDLAKGIADALGVEAEFDRDSHDFSQLLDKVRFGEADMVISTFSMSLERTKYVSFSNPYITTYLSIMVGKQFLMRNQIEANPLDFLKSNKVIIGAQEGTFYEYIAPQLFPLAEIIPLFDENDACKKIQSGEIQAYLSNELQLLLAFESNPVITLYATVYSFTDLADHFSVAVSRQAPQLLNFVNVYLRVGKVATYYDIANAFKARYGGSY